MYYVFLNNKDEYVVSGPTNHRPPDAIIKADKSLIGKKIKLIDKPLLNPDGTEQTDLEGNVITEKVAVLDEAKQAEHEAKVKAEKQEKEAEALEKEQRKARIKELKDKKDKMTKEEQLELLLKIAEHLGM